jgi:hypothetical protein
MAQDPYRPSEGHPMRRFAIFAAVLFIIIGIGSQPWNGGWRGFVQGFHAHAKPLEALPSGSGFTTPDGWTIDSCTGQDQNHTNWGWGHQEHACEMRSITIPRPDKLSVSSMNGGIHILGENRQDIAIEARIESWANSSSEAADILREIQIETAGGTIHDKGTNFHWGRQGYGISYTIHAPRQLAADLKTLNGGISLEHLNGDIGFDTTNGGVDLTDLAGNVHGSTVNGGLDISLSGERWDGKGLDAQTTNGGISLNIPENYSAHLETGTVNGGIEVNFPITIQGEIKHHLATDIGSGGPTIHAETTNGGVTLSHTSGGDSGNEGSHGAAD